MRKSLIAAFALFALSSVALAQSTAPVVEPGGCANGAFLGGTAYPTMDPSGRGCSATSPSTLGWYSYTNILTNTTVTIKPTSGVLHSITINSKGSAGNTATLFDSTTGSGTKIGTIDTTSSVGALIYDTNYLTALTIVLSGGTTAADLTAAFK